jgi:CRISPR-associated protein Csd1
MGWMQKLYETYERCNGAPQFDKDPLMPVGHTQQQAHVEVVLDHMGNFRRAKVLEDRDTTVVPATEGSAGRTSKPVPHPLCDKIQYCAGDYKDFGGTKEPCFEPYLNQLCNWQDSFPTAKGMAVLRYVRRCTMVADLLQAGVLHCDEERSLLMEWPHDPPAPPILRALPLKEKKRDQGDAFVRWRV